MRAWAHIPRTWQVDDARRLLWQWWSGEIAAMVPASLRRWLAGERGRLVAVIEQDRATFQEDLGGRRRRLGVLNLTLAEPQAVRRMLVTATDDLILEFPADAALHRRVALPAAAEVNLAEVVSFELERHTPFRRTEVYHGFKIVARDATRHRIEIELTVVPKDVVDSAILRVGRLGLYVAAVRTAGDGAGAEPSPNLLPVRPAARVPRLPHVAIWVAVLTAVVLATAAVVIPIVRAHEEATRLEADLQAAKQQAAESTRLQKEIDAALRERGFLAAHRQKMVPVSRLLAMVTKLLPDDTWLTEMRVSGADLEIGGLSASSSAIIAILDGASGFTDAGFRSPVTQDQRRLEQFDIGVHVGAAATK